MTSTQYSDTKPLDKDEALRAWAICDLWPLDDAIRLLCDDTLVPPGESWPNTETSNPERYRLLCVIAKQCAGKSLHVERSPAAPETLCVEPAQFLLWAQSKVLPTPTALIAAVDEYGREPVTGTRRRRKLTDSQRHQHRCRGIAALIWEQEPGLTIAAMIRRPEIRSIGCEDKEYGETQLRKWVNDLAPNRKPGRRPTAN